jgi:hypothetical protein
MTDLPVSGGNAHRHYGTDGFYITELSLRFLDVALGNATTVVHGLMPKLSGNITDCLSGTGTWISISGIPAGSILGCTGDTDDCPDGYLICDGTSGTPDLTINFLSDGGPTKLIIPSGLDIAKPAPSDSGELYWATDTEKMYYDPLP